MVKVDPNEPAATGTNASVPKVDAWKRAAAHGAKVRAHAAIEAAKVERPAGGPGAGAAPARSAAARSPAVSSATAPSAPGQAGTAPPALAPSSAVIGATLLAAIVDWSVAGRPNEACGLLFSDRLAVEGGRPRRFVTAANAAASPYRYMIEAQELYQLISTAEEKDEVVWGIVHSHVQSPAEPSNTDIGIALSDSGALWPGSLYLICSLATVPASVRAWSIDVDSVTEVPLEIR